MKLVISITVVMMFLGLFAAVAAGDEIPNSDAACAEDEERQEDGTCKQALPPETCSTDNRLSFADPDCNVIPEHCGMSDRVPDAPDCFTPEPPTPVATSVVQSPTSLPDTGSGP